MRARLPIRPGFSLLCGLLGAPLCSLWLVLDKHKPHRSETSADRYYSKDGLPASHKNVSSRVTYLLLPAINSSEKCSAERKVKALEREPEERLLIEAAQSEPARFAELYDRNFDRVYA